MKRFSVLALSGILFLLSLAAYADVSGYGLVESYGGGELVVRLENSVGHWSVDKVTKVTGAVAVADWVFVDVETSGHVKSLKVEEVPTVHAGVVKQVKGNVLVVRTGSAEETWNVTPLTMLNGITAASSFRVTRSG